MPDRLEQQGSIVNQWFPGNNDSPGRQAQWPSMDKSQNPYYEYISGNILTGRILHELAVTLSQGNKLLVLIQREMEQGQRVARLRGAAN